MRSAFIRPEENLIEFINHIISKISASKLPNKKIQDLNQSIITILENAKTKIQQVSDDYPDLHSKKTTHQLTAVWNLLTDMQDTFLEGVTEFYDGIVRIKNQIPAAKTRAESIAEFIANQSAAKDNGASQTKVLKKITSEVIANAAIAILQLSETDMDSEDKRRACVTQALSQEADRLRELGDPDVLAMWKNQEAAVADMTAQFTALELKSKTMSALEEKIIDAWNDFNHIMEQYDQDAEKENARHESLVTIIKETVQCIHHAQKNIKAPLNHFGLNDIVSEIESGQEKYFEAFRAAQSKLREGIEIVYAFADEAPENTQGTNSASCSTSDSESDSDSDSDSVSSSNSSSSSSSLSSSHFWSTSRKRGREESPSLSRFGL